MDRSPELRREAENTARAQRAARVGYGVRGMRVADAARVAQVHVEVWREAYRSLMSLDYLAGLSVDEFAELWYQRLSSPAAAAVKHIVGVHPRGHIVALASAGTSRDSVPAADRELWAINVRSSDHGTGLADLMMTELLDGRSCSLWVLRENARALAFYARYGFLADGGEKLHDATGLSEIRLVRQGR